jgi:hypothetical protein
MGIFDSGDITGAVVLALLLLPALFDREERIKNEK